MKIIGAVMIGVSCAYLGFARSIGMRNRCTVLQRLISAMEMLETEIRFNRTEIKKAFDNTEELVKLNGFLKAAGAGIESMGIKKSWNKAADKCLRDITEADRNIVKMLSAKLGMTDAAEQIKQMEYVKNLLIKQAESAEGEYKRLGRLSRSGGLLAGALIVLILI